MRKSPPMKKFAVPAVLLAAFAVCAQAQTAAQNVVPKQIADTEKPENRIVLEVNRVNVLFTVSDKHGRFVNDLGKSDFDIFENKKPQNITEFAAESDLPLRLAI